MQYTPNDIHEVAALAAFLKHMDPYATPFTIGADVVEIKKAARALHKYAERLANGHNSEAKRRRDEQFRDRMLALVIKKASAYNLGVRHNDDPRGVPFWLTYKRENGVGTYAVTW